jgi:hypothetical protein
MQAAGQPVRNEPSESDDVAAEDAREQTASFFNGDGSENRVAGPYSGAAETIVFEPELSIWSSPNCERSM